jgi:PAS domain S-box-containing protein
MKTRRAILGISLLFGLVLWVVDAVLDRLLFYRGSFWGLLILDVPPHELYIRVVIAGLFLVFGAIASTVIERLETAKARLLTEREFLAVTLRSIGDGVISVDPDGRVVALNKKAEELTGWPEQDAVGLPLEDVFHIVRQKTRERCENPVQKVLRTGTVQGLANDTVLIAKDGSERILADSGAPIHDERGRICGVVLVFRDVTDQRRAEEAVCLERDKAQKYLDVAATIVVALDRSGNIMLLNRSGCKLLGQQYTEAAGKNWFDEFLPVRDRQAVKEVFARMMMGDFEPVGYYENPVLARSGEERLIGWRNTVLTDAAGNILGTLSSGEDITDRKLAEEQLAEYREHLERLVEESTAELKKAHEALVQKERLAVLGKLTATVSHEIRNPLGTIRAAVFSVGDAIKRNELHRVERALKLAERNVVRCDRILEDLLDFTRIKTLSREPTDIDPWVQEIIGEQTIPDDVECSEELSSEVKISVDRERLRRAVVNVFKNALDAVREKESGVKKIKVITRAVDGGLELEIDDTGPGIPDNVQDKMFQPLFSTKGFGVGLGLPIVESIIGQHGGRVEVKSDTGNGTSVILRLPAAESPRSEE